MEGGVQLGISSRGLGSLPTGRSHHGRRRLSVALFDLVSEPSTTGAFLVAENQVKTHLTKADRINRALNDILGNE